MSEDFSIYYLTAPNGVNGNPRRGWFIVYPSGLHRWVEEELRGNYNLREELMGPERGGYRSWQMDADDVAWRARTAHYNITVGTYKSLRSCAAQSRLPVLSENNYQGEWVWA